MKLFLTTLVLSFISCFVFSQQIELRGRVSIHNSKYNTGIIEYVKNAYVTAPFTRPDDTDDEGWFELEFVGIDAGTSVKVQVEKVDLEVVNEYDLQRVIIGRKLPLRIYLTSAGQLAIAQTELYNISKTALYKQKNGLIARLYASEAESQAAIAELEKRFGQEIENRFEAEELLNNKIAELETRLPDFAQDLATKNLDFASELFIEAYEYYKKGEIEQAIEVLDDAKLEQSYQEANDNITEGEKLENIGKDLQEKGLLQIVQIINSYELKAESFMLLFDYGSAAQLYEKIIKIYEANQFDEEELAILYKKIAWVNFFDGKYKIALEYHQRCIAIIEKLPDLVHFDSYDDLAQTYLALGNYNKALEYNQRSITILEEIVDPKNSNLGTYYNNIALTFQDLGEYEKALEYQQKCIAILEEILRPNSLNLGKSYNNIAEIYRFLGDYDRAIDYHQRSNLILLDSLGPKHPIVATSYNNLALTYLSLGDYNMALKYHQKCIAIQEEILDPQHPNLASSYSSIAMTYLKLGDFDRSLDYNQRSITILEGIFMSQHPDLAYSYSSIAMSYLYLGIAQK
jgi:tetratricopeptide (TPR) repeat protein